MESEELEKVLQADRITKSLEIFKSNISLAVSIPSSLSSLMFEKINEGSSIKSLSPIDTACEAIARILVAWFSSDLKLYSLAFLPKNVFVLLYSKSSWM